MSQHDDENLQNSNTEEQDPCDDISIPPPPDPCIENPGAPGCPDSTGGEIAIEEVFFPAPENTIRATPQEAVASVSREITVIKIVEIKYLNKMFVLLLHKMVAKITIKKGFKTSTG